MRSLRFGDRPASPAATRDRDYGEPSDDWKRRINVHKSLSFNRSDVEQQQQQQEGGQHAPGPAAPFSLSSASSSSVPAHALHNGYHRPSSPPSATTAPAPAGGGASPDGHIVFSPIGQIAPINESRLKNRGVRMTINEGKQQASAVSVTSVIDVNERGRRTRSIMAKNVKELVETARQDPSLQSELGQAYRRVSSFGLDSPASAATSMPHGMMRRMSSLAEATEDVSLNASTGQLEMKPMKVQPPEFAKAINDRAKLTFYEVMSASGSSPPSAAAAAGYGYGGSPNARPSSAAARASGGASPSPLHLPSMNGRPQQPQVFTPKARRLTIDR